MWRIGRRLFDPRAATLAALIFWVWPEAYVYLSTVEYGFRFLTLVCGLAVLLFALRLAEPRAQRLTDWAALGLFLGLGWWCSPEILYFAMPALLWFGYHAVRARVRPPLAGAALFVATVALGALPWLAANLGHGYPSLRSVPQPHGGTWAGRVGVFFQHVVPLVLGVRLRGSGHWLAGQALGVTLYVLLVVLVLTWVALLVRKRGAGPLAVFVILFPFAYAVPTFSWYWRDGRYAIYLAPVLALLVASALCEIGRRPSRLARAAPALGLIAALVLTMAAAGQLAPYVPLAGSSGSHSGWTSWSADPDEWVRPLVTTLERSHVEGAYVTYWVAYTVTFEAHGHVVATDPGMDRYPPYLAAIARSPGQAWVFPTPSALDALNAAVGLHPWLLGRGWALADFEAYLSAHDVAYRTEDAGYFTIVYPARAVAAAVVLRVPGP